MWGGCLQGGRLSAKDVRVSGNQGTSLGFRVEGLGSLLSSQFKKDYHRLRSICRVPAFMESAI